MVWVAGLYTMRYKADTSSLHKHLGYVHFPQLKPAKRSKAVTDRQTGTHIHRYIHAYTPFWRLQHLVCLAQLTNVPNAGLVVTSLESVSRTLPRSILHLLALISLRIQIQAGMSESKIPARLTALYCLDVG